MLVGTNIPIEIEASIILPDTNKDCTEFFLHNVYCKEKLHHIITLLAEHLSGLSPYIQPNEDIDLMF
jgi:hypothetical protein